MQKLGDFLATLNIKLSLTNPIPSDPLHSDELSVHRLFNRFLPASTVQAVCSNAKLYSTL